MAKDVLEAKQSIKRYEKSVTKTAISYLSSYMLVNAGQFHFLSSVKYSTVVIVFSFCICGSNTSKELT